MEFADLRADGIVVRPWRALDLAAFTALQHDPDGRRWSPAFERKSAEALQQSLDHEVEVGPGGGPGGFAVVDADLERVLGEVSYRLDLPIPPFSIADVGYTVLPSARGGGVASTALRLLTAWLMDPAGADLARVQLDHAVGNRASCRTAARAGYLQEGIRPGYLPLREHAAAPIVRHATCLHGTVRP